MPLLLRGALYYFFYFGAIGLYQGFQAIHFRELGISTPRIGFILALFPLCTVLLSPAIAAWADAWQKRVMVLVVSLIATILSLISLAFARDFWSVLLGMLALGISQSAVAPLADSLIGRMASKNGLEYGRMRTWGSISFALCSAVGGLIWAKFGFPAMFWVSGLVLLPLLWLVRTLPEIEAQSKQVRYGLWSTLQEVLRGDRGTLAVLMMSLLMGLGQGMAAPFINLALQDRGGSVALAGLMYGIIAGVEAPIMQIERRIARLLGDAHSLVLSAGIYALAYLGIALVTSAIPMLFLAALIGIGFGLFYVGTVRVIDARAQAHQVSTLQSFRNGLGFGLAPLVAGPLGGWLYQSYGPVVVFASSALVYSCAAILLWAARKHVNRLPEHIHAS